MFVENYFVTNVYMDIFKGYTCMSSIIHAAYRIFSIKRRVKTANF